MFAYLRPGDFTRPFALPLMKIGYARVSTQDQQLHLQVDALQAAGVENTGVKVDTVGPMKYVAFKDPDRIAWEFYMV